MRLRIIAGKLKGRFINISQGSARFRPTLERTRQSVSEIIKSYIPGSIVADICAGSGAFGFEMISRGALRVDFIEKDRRRAELLVKNSRILDIAGQCRCIIDDVRAFVKRTKERYDMIFYDPPYSDRDLQLLIPDLLNLLAVGGILIYERTAGKDFPQDESAGEVCFDIRKFGDTVVEFYNSKRSIE